MRARSGREPGYRVVRPNTIAWCLQPRLADAALLRGMRSVRRAARGGGACGGNAAESGASWERAELRRSAATVSSPVCGDSVGAECVWASAARVLKRLQRRA